MLAPDPERARARSCERVRDLAVDTGVPMTIGIIATDPGRPRDARAHSTASPTAGGRMIGQTHCRGINVLLSFKTRLPFDLLPEWQRGARAPARGAAARAARSRRSARGSSTAAIDGDYTRWRGIGAMPRKPDFDGIRVYERGLPPNPTVAEVAAARGVTRSR